MGNNLKGIIFQLERLYEINCFKEIRKVLEGIFKSDEKYEIEDLKGLLDFSFKVCMATEFGEFLRKNIKISEIDSLDDDYKILFTYFIEERFRPLIREFQREKLKSFYYSFLVWQNRENLNVEEQKRILKDAYSKYPKNLLAAYGLLNLGESIEVGDCAILIDLGLDIKKIKLKEFKGEFSIFPLGGGDEVGGSSYLLNINGNNILVDAGARIRGEALEYPNFKELKRVSIKYLFITHAHLDHCGALLELLKEKEDLIIFCTKETRELMEFNLSSFEKGIDRILKISEVMGQVKVLNFNEKVNIGLDLQATLVPAGHILGASSIFFETSKGNVFFTGDFSVENQKTVEGLRIQGREANILVTETTYGDRIEKNNLTYNECLLKRKVLDYMEKGQSVLIPAFALGRAQEIVLVLQELNRRIYVDGGAASVSKLYLTLLDKREGQKVYYVGDKGDDRRKAILEEAMETPLCIVSSSGMLLDGSAASIYAENIVERPEFALILTGFQGFDTTGARLKSQMEYKKGERFVDINQRRYRVYCDLENFSLSAHADVFDITALTVVMKSKHVVFIHGNNGGEESILFKKIKNLTNSKVYISKNNEWTKIGGEN